MQRLVRTLLALLAFGGMTAALAQASEFFSAEDLARSLAAMEMEAEGPADQP